MNQTQENGPVHDLSGMENVLSSTQTTSNNVCSGWNYSDAFCQSNGVQQEKEYNFGSLPCCTQMQGPFSEPSWNSIGFQFNESQYASSACCLLEQAKIKPGNAPSKLVSHSDITPYMKDFIDNCSSISMQGSVCSDYRLMNYPHSQNIYNTTHSGQEPLLYPQYNTNHATNFGYCLETECLDKVYSPSRSNLSSCGIGQNPDFVNVRNEMPNQNHNSQELSGLLPLSNSEDSTILRVNDSDDDSDIIVEDSDTESEISIDVGPYIRSKEADKETVMRCFVCNLSYSEKSQANFVQVNSSFPLTFVSQTPVMLKLIEIIPIDMQTSVKFENNLICRRCLNLIDTIEHLEVRLVSVKKAICDFVSRSGKESEDDVNFIHENNNVCVNIDDNSSMESIKHSSKEMVTTGVNTDVSEKRVEMNGEETESLRIGQEGLNEVVSLYQCDRCGKMYKREKELKKHLRKHAGLFAETCIECGKGFMKTRNLELHMRKHRSYVCSKCRASFSEETALANHLLACTESKFICGECTLLFNTQEKLNAHSEKHNKSPSVCDICSKSFKNPSGLEAHKKSHSDEKPFSCDKCGLKYKNRSHLSRHQKSHSLPYNCSTCRAMFSSSEELQSHSLLLHSEKLKCDECTKQFISKSNMMDHKKNVHSGSRNRKTCPICKKLISSNFKAHLQTHSKENKFKCMICEMDFAFKHSMVKHLKRKHNKLNNSHTYDWLWLLSNLDPPFLLYELSN